MKHGRSSTDCGSWVQSRAACVVVAPSRSGCRDEVVPGRVNDRRVIVAARAVRVDRIARAARAQNQEPGAARRAALGGSLRPGQRSPQKRRREARGQRGEPGASEQNLRELSSGSRHDRSFRHQNPEVVVNGAVQASTNVDCSAASSGLPLGQHRSQWLSSRARSSAARGSLAGHAHQLVQRAFDRSRAIAREQERRRDTAGAGAQKPAREPLAQAARWRRWRTRSARSPSAARRCPARTRSLGRLPA